MSGPLLHASSPYGRDAGGQEPVLLPQRRENGQGAAAAHTCGEQEWGYGTGRGRWVRE